MTGKVSVPSQVMTFRGSVSCQRDDGGPLGLTLIGQAADRPNETVALAFSGRAPDTLPESLENPTVEHLGPETYLIISAPREWLVEARSVHVHREIATPFYAAIAPRTAPWTKRLFWRLVLTLAANPLGKRVLLTLRGR